MRIVGLDGMTHHEPNILNMSKLSEINGYGRDFYVKIMCLF